MYPTKNGSWTRSGLEDMDYKKMADTFTGSTCESRNRPTFGFQELAHTLLLAEPHLRDGVAKGIFGSAISTLISQIDGHKDALAQIDGASRAVKTKSSFSAGVSDVIEWLHELSGKGKFRELLPKLQFGGEVCRHVSQQMCEWVSAAEDPKAYAKSVTTIANQPESELLAKMTKAKDSKSGRDLLKAYFKNTLSPKADKASKDDPASTEPGSFSNFMDDSDDASKDDGACADTGKDASPAPKGGKTRRANRTAEEGDGTEAPVEESAEERPPSKKHKKRHQDDESAEERPKEKKHKKRHQDA